jgi:hypothetical protein
MDGIDSIKQIALIFLKVAIVGHRQCLEQSQSARPNIYFKGAGKIKKVSDDKSKNTDFENSLSYINDVAATAVFFAVNLPKPGIYNVGNAGTKTTRECSDAMGLNKEWFTKEEFIAATNAPRSNCNMNVDKLNKVFPVQHVDDALANAVRNLTNA